MRGSDRVRAANGPPSLEVLRRAGTEMRHSDNRAARPDRWDTASEISITVASVVRSPGVRRADAPPSAYSLPEKAVDQACSAEGSSAARPLHNPLVRHVGQSTSSDGIPRVPTLNLALLHTRTSVPLSSLGESDQAPPPQIKPQWQKKDDIVGHLNEIQSQLERRLSTVRLEYQKKLSESALVGFAKRRSARMLSMRTDESISLHSESSKRQDMVRRPELRGHSGAYNAATAVNARGRQRNASPPRMAAGPPPRRPSGKVPSPDHGKVGAPMTRYATFATAKRGSRAPSRFVPPDWNALVNKETPDEKDGPSKQDNKTAAHATPSAPPAQPDNILPAEALMRPPEMREARKPPPTSLRLSSLHRKNENTYDVNLVNNVCRRATTKPVGPNMLERATTAAMGKFEGVKESVINGFRRSQTSALLSRSAEENKDDVKPSMVTFKPFQSPTLSEQDLSSKTVTDEGWPGSPLARAYSYVDRVIHGTSGNEAAEEKAQPVARPPSRQVAGGEPAPNQRDRNARSIRYLENIERAMPRPVASETRVEVETETGNEAPMRRQTTVTLRRRDTYTVDAEQIRDKLRAAAEPASESSEDDDNTSYQVVSVSGSDLEEVSGQYEQPEQQRPFIINENMVERNVDAASLTHLPTISGNHVKGIAGYSLEYLNQLSKVNSKYALLRQRELDASVEMGNTSGFGHQASLRTSVKPWFRNPLAEKAWRKRANGAKYASFIPNARHVEHTTDAALKKQMDQLATYRLDLEERERHGVMDPFYEYEKAKQNKTLIDSDWAKYGRPVGKH
ncbi:hypothetical protein, conserved [Babesia ovata]|uniref:Uncharacterized protein n=1 Tax=Babesia ovata TaxID=189622 RepID=A0A2H6KAV3_9APIC|nr:uncharacterized protein BOVATA_016130 [Babesia ovata]GBE60120.1 hypothetical protein, conserved [Babesia ovata]